MTEGLRSGIETITQENIDEVIPLVREYLEFYNVKEISDDQNREFFLQFALNNELGIQFGYRKGGSMVGFASVYFSFSTSVAGKVAVLNDIYTVPIFRGQGVGKKLVLHAHKFALERGAKRLQWFTAQTNIRSHALYQSLGAKRSAWYFYAM